MGKGILQGYNEQKRPNIYTEAMPSSFPCQGSVRGS